MLPGWLLDAVGNDGTRGMVIARSRVTGSGNRTRLMVCFGQDNMIRLTLKREDLLADLGMWDDAVTAVRIEYTDLSASTKRELKRVVGMIQREKMEISSLMENADVAGICARCAGECCKSGKYHFTVIDLLVFLDSETDLFRPVFKEARCPFLGRDGCLMEPRVRPFTCITFFCERVESLLTRSETARLRVVEESLRRLYAEVEQLFGKRLMQGLLMNYERLIEGKAAGILL